MQKELAVFFSKIDEVFKSQKPFVAYRNSTEKIVKAYIQKSVELKTLKGFSESGFVFAPFNNSEKTVLFPLHNCDFISTEINSKTDLEIHFNKNEIHYNFDNFLKEKHICLVEKGIDFIKSNKAKKIVLSRKETVQSDSFDVINTFKKMLCNYNNAFVYLWYHPKVGLWMGATPERLLNIKNNHLKTMALAGTQSYKGFINVVWQKKEIQEQQFVTDYILENLKNDVKNLSLSKPYTVKAGNLLHLRTDIFGELKSKDAIKKMIQLLHPTPAVCGLPKNTAFNFIVQNENYNRSFYSGYLGELNINNSTNLVVNLRCMQLENEKVSIYVGGGITIDSNPVKEWEETIFKTNVIKSVL